MSSLRRANGRIVRDAESPSTFAASHGTSSDQERADRLVTLGSTEPGSTGPRLGCRPWSRWFPDNPGVFERTWISPTMAVEDFTQWEAKDESSRLGKRSENLPSLLLS